MVQHEDIDHTGVPGVPAGGGAEPDCKEAFMSADSLSSGGANALFDLTGASLSLGAGDWLVEGFAVASDSNASTTFIGLSIHDGSASVAVSANTKPAGAGERTHITVSKRITLGGTATVKLQGVSTRTTTTFIRNPAAVWSVGAANTGCAIHATKVTAA